MYDIRYPPNGLQRNPKPNDKRHTSTKPYLTFPEYTPSLMPYHDFDVCPELGLLAGCKCNHLDQAVLIMSATDDRGKDSSNGVQLFSLRTGQQVSSPLSRFSYAQPIKSVCFESGDGSLRGPQTPSLLVCAKATVDQWTW